MTYTFRPFNIETDKKLVKKFLLDTQTITGTIPEDIERDGDSYVSAILAAQKSDPESCAFLLEEGIVIGFIDAQPSKKRLGNGFIRFDYIIPQKRRLGLGCKLLDYAFERLRNAGCNKIYLDVVQSNFAAIAFYEKNGWISTGEINAPFIKMCRLI